MPGTIADPVTGEIKDYYIIAALVYPEGVEPDPEHWPELRRGLLFGPLSPASFRLVGPERRADAAARTMADAALFGCIASPTMTDEEAARWDGVRTRLHADAA